MRIFTITMVLFSLGSALAGSAFAASAEPLVSRMDVYRIVDDGDGGERAEAADETLPGEVLEYRLSYENTSDAPLRALVITGPIPANTDYVAASAATMVASRLLVSIDGAGSFEAEPVIRERTLPDGSIEEYVVPPQEYTHVRWRSTTPLAPATTQQFRYRVIVE